MNSMVAVTDPGLRSGPYGSCQWVAVQSLRRLARPCSVGEGSHAALPSAEMARAGTAFQAFLTAVPRVPGVRAPNFLYAWFLKGWLENVSFLLACLIEQIENICL